MLPRLARPPDDTLATTLRTASSESPCARCPDKGPWPAQGLSCFPGFARRHYDDHVRPADLALAMRTITSLKTGQARQTREASGASQSDIAAVLGVTRQAVCQWEAGVRRPRVAHAAAYGHLLRRLAKESAA